MGMFIERTSKPGSLTRWEGCWCYFKLPAVLITSHILPTLLLWTRRSEFIIQLTIQKVDMVMLCSSLTRHRHFYISTPLFLPTRNHDLIYVLYSQWLRADRNSELVCRECPSSSNREFPSRICSYTEKKKIYVRQQSEKQNIIKGRHIKTIFCRKNQIFEPKVGILHIGF